VQINSRWPTEFRSMCQFCDVVAAATHLADKLPLVVAGANGHSLLNITRDNEAGGQAAALLQLNSRWPTDVCSIPSIW
jgi:hypothetical protein